MTIEQPDVIDLAATDRAHGSMRLIISDHLPWEGHHLLTLQNKINTYLAFLESGEMYSVFPDAKGLKFSIVVVCLHRPSEMAQTFLSRAKSTVEGAGFGFSYEPGAEGYVEDAA